MYPDLEHLTRLRLLLAVVLTLVLSSSIATPVVASQVSTPSAGEDQFYVDPDDRFAIPIPTNWTAEEQDGWVRVATNDGEIWIAAAIVEANGATLAIDQFMRQLDPEFSSDALATPESANESAFYTFDDGAESGQLSQALGRKIGENAVFVLVLQGELETVERRQVQVDKIFNGILIRTASDATPVASPAA